MNPWAFNAINNKLGQLVTATQMAGRRARRAFGTRGGRHRMARHARVALTRSQKRLQGLVGGFQNPRRLIRQGQKTKGFQGSVMRAAGYGIQGGQRGSFTGAAAGVAGAAGALGSNIPHYGKAAEALGESRKNQGA